MAEADYSRRGRGFALSIVAAGIALGPSILALDAYQRSRLFVASVLGWARAYAEAKPPPKALGTTAPLPVLPPSASVPPFPAAPPQPGSLPPDAAVLPAGTPTPGTTGGETIA